VELWVKRFSVDGLVLARPANHSTRSTTQEREAQTCGDGRSKFPYRGSDSSERLLLREGLISKIPKSLCGNKNGKNVILVVGDGMGWEMARAGAIGRRVVDELEGLGCNTKMGCPTNAAAKAAFAGRKLKDYYLEGTNALTRRPQDLWFVFTCPVLTLSP
jgi:hypothetical protein